MPEPDRHTDHPPAPAAPPAAWDDTPQPEQRRFPCSQCGGRLTFAPGTDELVCPYCSHRNTIAAAESLATEQDFGEAMKRLEAGRDTVEHFTVTCDACGARPEVSAKATATACPFCGSSIVSQARASAVIKPDSVLPFAIGEDRARDAFRKWIASLWFAPSELKNFVRQESRLGGVYIPSWTYDTRVTTWYRGRRGDAYYVTVPYTVMVNGRPQTRMRQERRIRWSPASGVVSNAFDDLLVVATAALPEKHLTALEPWDTQAAVPYADEFLSGFTSESYSIDLKQGLEVARGMMAPVIHQTICADIGGDEQQVTDTRQKFDSITFKHLLLPVWISAYRYRGRVFRLLVNARTGEVQGQRPYSPWKIGFAVVGGLIVIGVVALLIAMNQR
jgi:DNA-directed RNA polymerase subunit RPC12/RpoP